MASGGEAMDVIFYFDFGSPNAYLAHKVIPAIEARTGVRFAYVPALLGGYGAAHDRPPRPTPASR
jgi:2-hydroxychromene-2-carboxylate isomerase